MSGNNQYQKWLEKAEEDEFAGKEILEGRRFPAPACFHFQQMVEKLLKALLIFYGKDFPKIHDLIVLSSLLKPIIKDIQDYKEDLKFLDRYYIETRYPGDYPEFSLQEAKEALEAAERIKEFILNKIKSEHE